ncbi:DUF3253 domain-containing protein [Altererythrobacter sp. TH136]|uniref:DUF3253 domain-containing protein n=1 Tax=Altererythrobacter sp. TH136 TaxID=2067415 RepID=UPI0011659CE7|nr:DUF3253 domain-containing protein [Altererythrobacter sp. TH136]QDM39951.1 DUF3253 domain-containing protein [Altererythrobacter sp. TH136]
MDAATVAIIALLAERRSGESICPSEAARRIAAEASEADWRASMPIIHAAVDQLVDQNRISLSWKGQSLSARCGPYRIVQANDK